MSCTNHSYENDVEELLQEIMLVRARNMRLESEVERLEIEVELLRQQVKQSSH